MLLFAVACLFLLSIVTLLPSPTHPPTASATTSYNNTRNNNDNTNTNTNTNVQQNPEITIQAPAYLSLQSSSPIPAHVSLNFSEPMRFKLSLLSPNGKHAAKFWNGSQWVYPGGSWNYMPILDHKFQGFFFIRPQESYSGWKDLEGSGTADITVTVRKLNSTSSTKTSVPVTLIGPPAENRTSGFRISGGVYRNGKPLEEGFIRLITPPSTIIHNGSDLLNGTISFCFTSSSAMHSTGSRIHPHSSSPVIGGNEESSGYYELWAPGGEYVLEVYSNHQQTSPVYSANITLDSNLTVDFQKPPPPPPPVKGNDHIMIVEVHYNTYGGGADEYLALFNPLNSSHRLINWILTDGEHIHFLDNVTLLPSEKVYIARNPERFLSLTSMTTGFTFPLSLSDTKDSLSIIDPVGTIVDAVSWGGEEIEGFNGSLAGYSAGRVLRRNRVEGWDQNRSYDWQYQESNTRVLPQYQDSNSMEDWESSRKFMVGQSELPFNTYSVPGNITAFLSPDSSFAVIAGELENATSSIKLNMYELTNHQLFDCLIRALNRSVSVSLFLEGSPVGGISDTELYFSYQLSNAGADVRFLHNNGSVKDRYNYDHAKYCVIDHNMLIIDSENWKSTGIPVDPTAGNRGWGVVIRDTGVAEFFETLFDEDSSLIFSDVVSFGTEPYVKPNNYSPNPSIFSGAYVPQFPPLRVNGNCSVTTVIAPDHTLRDDAILGMISGARRSVYIEQLQCSMSWGDGLPNFYLDAAMEAAERGCEVRILLDSTFVNVLDGYSDNYDTVEYINSIARDRGLTNLQAKLMVMKGLSKLHNKGVIVDGEYTLVSSINWGKGAVLLNREAGVIIRNRDIAEYFTNVFLYDWNLKERPWEGGADEDDAEQRIRRAQYVFSAISILGGITVAGFLRKRSQ